MSGASSQPTNRPWQFSLRALLVAMAVIGSVVGICGGFLAYSVRQARDAAYTSECRSNIYGVATAIANHHDQKGSFPPPYAVDKSGKPLYSWRVLMMPYLEEQAFFQRYNRQAAWDDPGNLRLANDNDLFLWNCRLGPNHLRSHEMQSTSGRPRFVDYVAVTGPGTIFPGDKTITYADITDGQENTILLVEIANSDIHWTEPRDLHIDEMSFTINHPTKPSISSPHRSGPNVVFADRQVYRISESMPADVLKALVTIDGGENVTRDECERLGYIH